MLAVLALAVLTPLSYKIPSTPLSYNLDLLLNGYVPILGADQAKVELKVGLNVKSLAPEGDGNQRAATDVSSLKVLYNDAALPFTKDNVAQYFPNTVTLTPQGEVIKNDAPDLKLPIQIPGLDVRRFPDVTFLAIKFPTEGVEVGKSFSYAKKFGESDVNYTVTPTSITDTTALFDLKMTQEFEAQETDSHETALNPKDAVYNAKTHVLGSGDVQFDRTRGVIRLFHMKADTTADVTNLQTKEQSKRKLSIEMTVTLDNASH